MEGLDPSSDRHWTVALVDVLRGVFLAWGIDLLLVATAGWIALWWFGTVAALPPPARLEPEYGVGILINGNFGFMGALGLLILAPKSARRPVASVPLEAFRIAALAAGPMAVCAAGVALLGYAGITVGVASPPWLLLPAPWPRLASVGAACFVGGAAVRIHFAAEPDPDALAVERSARRRLRAAASQWLEPARAVASRPWGLRDPG